MIQVCLLSQSAYEEHDQGKKAEPNKQATRQCTRAVWRFVHSYAVHFIVHLSTLHVQLEVERTEPSQKHSIKAGVCVRKLFERSNKQYRAKL